MATTTARAARANEPGTVRLRALVWVAWRQHRAALAGLLILVGGAALVMLVTGLHIQAIYAQYARAHCSQGHLTTACLNASNNLAGYKEDTPLVALHLLPILIGTFLGAPLLAREIEAGTFRFAWTQGVGSGRLLLVKMVLLAVVVAALCLALGALATWWLHPFDVLGVSSRWQAGEYDVAPLTFAGWGLLGFAGGALAGALIKRTVPAMAATAVVLTAVFGVFWWKLAYLVLSVAPLTTRAVPFDNPGGLTGPGPTALNTWPVAGASRLSGGWLVRGWFTQAGGRPMTATVYQHVAYALAGSDTSTARPADWLARHHDAFWVGYQPGGRFWIFQAGTGTALLLLAMLLAAATLATMRRRG